MISNQSKILCSLTAIAVSIISCAHKASVESEKKNRGWLANGTVDERFEKVSKHLRGFDMAMAETGYRYNELYWAGQDKNWGYASYQLEKMRTAIENGLERRPARSASAQMIFYPMEAVKRAITEGNMESFSGNFATLTKTCNACHQAESVPFVNIEPPQHRLSPVKFSSDSPLKKLDQKK